MLFMFQAILYFFFLVTGGRFVLMLRLNLHFTCALRLCELQDVGLFMYGGRAEMHTDTAERIKNALLFCTLKHICCETDQIRTFVSVIDCFTAASAAHSPHLCCGTLDRCCCLSLVCFNNQHLTNPEIKA